MERDDASVEVQNSSVSGFPVLCQHPGRLKARWALGIPGRTPTPPLLRCGALYHWGVGHSPEAE